ncbi:DUF1810 domain-containing protein [Actinoplanes sichuanensis]|uniref:DUF1810 domain-containing protein n=1 Tax=Actinoplanes sichuanensis TaxID=512349 RepID=A0ABW4AG04_9ACTN|nr:DUF1810 domain-containing protein [Actinoplanes sichuanensis]BEL02791.1 DUF1810 domain-containing protein [Actinoplanes sichuanensis]
MADLRRFVDAQEGVHEQALAELTDGRKRGHWMWFVFPQLDGLGVSSTARRYAIRDLEEARAYLAHPVLGARLVACAEAVLGHQRGTAEEILGYPDVLKLRSSMTLFACAASSSSSAPAFAPAAAGSPAWLRAGDEAGVFERVLGRYYDGPDPLTLQLLGVG